MLVFGHPHTVDTGVLSGCEMLALRHMCCLLHHTGVRSGCEMVALRHMCCLLIMHVRKCQLVLRELSHGFVPLYSG